MRATVSIVAAPLEEEIAPFLSRIEARADLRDPGLVTYRGRLRGEEVLAAVIGDGAGRAERGLRRLLEKTEPDRFLLIGVAGGLSPDLDVGSLVQARTVVSEREGRRELPAESDLSSLAEGTILSADEIACSVVEKAALWKRIGQQDRSVVDLESWTIAGCLDEIGCRLAIVRAVSDAADEDLPLDFGALSDEDGHVVRKRVLWSLMRRPSALIGVLRMRSRVLECARRLAAVAERWAVAGQGD